VPVPAHARGVGIVIHSRKAYQPANRATAEDRMFVHHGVQLSHQNPGPAVRTRVG
jgi:hypothetical protein